MFFRVDSETTASHMARIHAFTWCFDSWLEHCNGVYAAVISMCALFERI